MRNFAAVMVIILTVLTYFVALFALSRLTARRATNEAFYRADRRSPWYMVAFGMVGASISGVTFVSVPGMVLASQMTYLQLCLGFILGYVTVALVLLPLYYRLNLTTIYTYLGQRLGRRSYQTGASGARVLAISAPTRYLHSACCVAAKEDLLAVEQLTRAILERSIPLC